MKGIIHPSFITKSTNRRGNWNECIFYTSCQTNSTKGREVGGKVFSSHLITMSTKGRGDWMEEVHHTFSHNQVNKGKGVLEGNYFPHIFSQPSQQREGEIGGKVFFTHRFIN